MKAAIPIVLLLATAAPAFGGAKVTGTWKAPDLEPATYKKVAVLARISDEAARRILEDTVVAGLTKRKIPAVAAYTTFTPEQLADHASIRARAEELGIDAGIVFLVTGSTTQVKPAPQAHVSIGFGGYSGPFGVAVGTSVPLGGGGATTSEIVAVKSEFHAVGTEGPRWIANYSIDLDSGPENAAEEVASQALRYLKRAGLFR